MCLGGYMCVLGGWGEGVCVGGRGVCVGGGAVGVCWGGYVGVGGM